jgi:RND family efflux transporter MFP subunit
VSDPIHNDHLDPHPAPTHYGVYVMWIVVVVAVVFGGLFAAGLLPRLKSRRELDAEAAAVASASPRVSVVVAKRGATETDRGLPGYASAFFEAAIYARTSGYVKTRKADIGDAVKTGDILAEIDTPEIDAQLAQAKATLQKARADLLKAQADEEFARSEERRFLKLVETTAVSKEDYESKVQAAKVSAAATGAAQAIIRVDEADVQRLTALQSFEKVTAPFDGVVTARNIDVGALVNADPASNSKELFHVVQKTTLRVYVDVPQVYSTAVHADQSAVVFRREDPRKQYDGKVTRTAEALDPKTRTLRTEVDVANKSNDLLPGMYLQVKFKFDRDVAPVVIPAAALVTRTDGQAVAVVESGNKVAYRTVQLGRDYGADVEIVSGLDGGETVVVRPGDTLPAGTVVDPLPLDK